MKITVLGSGTSSGVPTIGCPCDVCRSNDPRDRRLRPSILIQTANSNIVIDTTPDFRAQILRAGLSGSTPSCLRTGMPITSPGLDDVRPFNFRHKTRIPIYAAPPAFKVISRVFEYVFDNQERVTMVPQLDVNVIGDEAFEVAGLRFEPIPIRHGKNMIHGFRFGNAAYLTDHSEVPEESMAKLQGLDVLFLDALRHKPHPTHSTVETSIATAQRLQAGRTFFTHICHDLPHAATEALLPPAIFLAYDGLEIAVNGEA